MRIVEMRVKQLFGLFDYTIPLGNPDRVCILAGPNGRGKTTLLRMLSGVFNRQFSVFARTPFEEFLVSLDTGERLLVTGGVAGRQATLFEGLPEEPPAKDWLTISYVQGEEAPPAWRIDLGPVRESRYGAEELADHLAHIHRVGPDEWLDAVRGTYLRSQDLLWDYVFEMPSRLRREVPEWFDRVCAGVSVGFVESQRLVAASEDTSLVPRRRVTGPPSKSLRAAPTRAVALSSAVMEDRRHLRTQIRDAHEMWAKVSQELDSSFPQRLVGELAQEQAIDEAQLTEDLEAARHKHAQLSASGLLSEHGDEGLQGPTTAQPDGRTNAVLRLYVDDMLKKQAVFSELLPKVELLAEFVGSLLDYKTLAIDPDEGYVCRDHAGNPMSPTCLSSGEQNQLILVYYMLFRATPDSMILIDEPELSLHVAWQSRFLPDLTRILAIAPSNVMLATHSPFIIGERWDLVRELRGTESA